MMPSLVVEEEINQPELNFEEPLREIIEIEPVKAPFSPSTFRLRRPLQQKHNQFPKQLKNLPF